MIEVEVKARIKDPREMERRVRKLADYAEQYTCSDTYFTFASSRGYQDMRFRLRLMKGRALVTAKEKKALSGVETNIEHEFEVDDPEAFRNFARLFGFRVLVEKTKSVKKFKYRIKGSSGFKGNVSIEINRVRGLGNFIEIEALVKDGRHAKKAGKMVLSILEELGISRDCIEQTPYTRLLYEKNIKRNSAGALSGKRGV